MIRKKYQSTFLFILALIVGLLLFLWVWSLALDASAQEITDTKPFELKHPDTKEPGTWIPLWLEKEHLQTENDLKTCQDLQLKRVKLLEEKDIELELRKKALDEEKRASEAATIAQANTALQLEDEKEKTETLGDWLLVTSTTGIAAVAALVLILVL